MIVRITVNKILKRLSAFGLYSKANVDNEAKESKKDGATTPKNEISSIKNLKI